MITIEYGTNNKEEKGKIVVNIDSDKSPDELCKIVDNIKTVYNYMRYGQEAQKLQKYLKDKNDNRP